jgi:NADPH:quinone reductase
MPVRAVVFTGAGGNEVVAVEQRPDPEPVGEEVLVRVRYAGLNPADVQQRDGKYPAPPGAPADIPGLEVAGEVVACGSRVQSWRPGDRVLGLVAGGGLADRVVVHERCVTRTPDNLDDVEAAAVPEAFITAHDAIRTQASLAMGETLLVHGATGGVGTAAVQIGLATGAQVIGVSRSEPGRALVEKLGALAVEDSDFAAATDQLTDGRGADVILELVGAPHFPANLEALAVKGRIVVVGVGAGSSTELPLLRLMQKRATLRGTVLRARPVEEKGQVLRAFEREVVPHLQNGLIRPLVDRTFDVDQVTDAFDHLEGQGKRGKLLLDFGD